MLRSAPACAPAESVAVTVKGKAPTAPGVPDRTPSARVSPGGNPPLAMANVYGGAPPLAPRICRGYSIPIAPAGSNAIAAVRVVGLIRMAVVVKAMPPEASVAWTVNMDKPGPSGFPETAPEGASQRPAGRKPLNSDQA